MQLSQLHGPWISSSSVNLDDLMTCSPRRAHGNVKIVPGSDDLDAVYRQILGMRVSQTTTVAPGTCWNLL